MAAPRFEALTRRTHLWLGTVAGLQLLAWTLGGLFFTLQPIDTVRGSHLVQQPPDLQANRLLSPLDAHPAWAAQPLQGLRLVLRPEGPAWLLGRTAVHALDGRVLPDLDASAATAIATGRTGLTALETVELQQVAADHEARGLPLPVWQVHLDHPSAARAYVDPVSGRLLAIRTGTWRIFDVMWMLHVMDYAEREVFWHGLIRVFAVLGLATVVSGLCLAVAVHRRRWRRWRGEAATA